MKKHHLILCQCMFFAIQKLRVVAEVSEPFRAGVGLKIRSLQRVLPPSHACSEAYLVLPVTFQKGKNRTSFIMRWDIFAISKI